MWGRAYKALTIYGQIERRRIEQEEGRLRGTLLEKVQIGPIGCCQMR